MEGALPPPPCAADFGGSRLPGKQELGCGRPGSPATPPPASRAAVGGGPELLGGGSKLGRQDSGAALLGKYQMGQLLGRGSFAKVYRASSLADGSPVAIKIIDKTKPITSAMEPQILREVAAMRRLQCHPNILKIHEVMATRTKIYLVMELASGGELFSKIVRRGRLTEPVARRYFQQLVSALRFCHRSGVVHRDVKPQNLLLDAAGALKVSDFGLSALPEQLRDGLLHTACGTPAYTAPEVVCRHGYDGSKADAWSCGVILFVLLAGYMPFDDHNLVAMYKRIHTRDYNFPDWISKPARYIIHQLLDPNPNTRMSLEALINTSWFKKSLNPKPRPDQSPVAELDMLDSKHDVIGTMNAFDIISLSSGLDLSGLFEATGGAKGKRFTSRASAEAIAERVRDVGSKLGFSVERRKGGTIGLGKGVGSVLAVEVSEIAESLLMVEVRVVGYGGVSLEEVQWGDWKAGLEELVLSWQKEAA
ncbi:CBL-interacting serine/threonine-protein kinase 4-like [Rhodamnia argentea]|uniref:non-specific serine/threonine protein kinase n=1 Tax=Rhodamnia argentea TaxID=178133 RepID=A0A8B8Q2A5_9MYRT|nr:CBL-interacting serine/threonine-protein kinase 4-like [Rhodamnia argentea]